MRHIAISFFVAWSVAAGAPLAFGHAAFPAAIDVQLPAGGGGLVVLTNFGFVLNAEGPGPQTFVCDELFLSPTDPPQLAATESVLLVGDFQGVWRSDDGGCTAAPGPVGGESRFVRGFAQGGDGALYLVTSSGSVPNDVYRSDDLGLTWEGVGAPTAGVFLTGIEAVQGGGADLVALGFFADSGDAVALWRSGSGAWTAQPVGPLTLDDSGQPALLDCAPDGARCLVRGAEDAEVRIFLIDADGGAELVYSGAEQLFGAAGFTPDGTLLVATSSGLRRSVDEGETWQQVPLLPAVTCLARIGGELYACANPYVPEGFLVGRSEDDGLTWEPFLGSFADIDELVSCEADSDLTAICGPVWTDLEASLGVGTETGEPDASGMDADATTEPGADAPEPGADSDVGSAGGGGDSGCAAAGGGRAPWGLLALALLLAVARVGSGARARRAP
jgi:hypothetical protein